MSGGSMALARETANADAFDLVFNVHHDYVYGLARNLLGNPQDAEDVTQDVFLRVYKALPSYQPERASIRTWLTRLAVNACQSHRRRNFLRSLLSRTPDEGEETPDQEDLSLWGAPEAHAVQTELRQAVKQVLAKLKLEHRTVVILHYYLDLSCQEIARILECPEGTVYSRLHYARRVVQAQLERHSPKLNSEVEL
jgi:RNA polymerase sigma-70 factor (ECF subfamily)